MSEHQTPPSGGRSDATRRALLRAARDEFAELGLAGARVDRIAETAGVNKERIYGLFGSKDKLFDAVLIDALQEFADLVDPMAAFGDARKFVGRLYDYHREHPQLLRLLAWEALHRGEDAHDIDGWRDDHYRQKIDRAMATFGADTRLRAGMATLALCGIPNYVNLMPQIKRLLLGDEADDEVAIREFLSDFAEAAATSLPGPRATPADNSSVKDLTDPVEAAAERLRRAQAEAEAARKTSTRRCARRTGAAPARTGSPGRSRAPCPDRSCSRFCPIRPRVRPARPRASPGRSPPR
ncbi:hypothetical protein GCM10029992_09410 [Glycomyces albus]